MARLYPVVEAIKRTWLRKYLVANAKDDSEIGVLMRFRDKLVEAGLRDIESGKVEEEEIEKAGLKGRKSLW